MVHTRHHQQRTSPEHHMATEKKVTSFLTILICLVEWSQQRSNNYPLVINVLPNTKYIRSSLNSKCHISVSPAANGRNLSNLSMSSAMVQVYIPTSAPLMNRQEGVLRADIGWIPITQRIRHLKNPTIDFFMKVFFLVEMQRLTERVCSFIKNDNGD